MRRRRTASLYSKTALQQSEHLQQITQRLLTTKLIPRLDGAANKNGIIDGLDLSYCICADYLSAFLFGYCNGSNYLKEPKAAVDVWRQHYENSMCDQLFFLQETPWLYTMLKTFNIDLIPASYKNSKRFLEDWVEKLSAKADKTLAATNTSIAAEDEPVVYAKTKQMVEKDSPHLSSRDKRLEVASEMFDHICKFYLRASHCANSSTTHATKNMSTAASREVLGKIHQICNTVRRLCNGSEY